MRDSTTIMGRKNMVVRLRGIGNNNRTDPVNVLKLRVS